jgi:hypothetical protein
MVGVERREMIECNGLSLGCWGSMEALGVSVMVVMRSTESAEALKPLFNAFGLKWSTEFVLMVLRGTGRRIIRRE